MSNLPNSNSNNRMPWRQYFAEIATLASKRSPCSRLQVGCVIVRDNRVVSTGYNGFMPGARHESIIEDGHELATIHAEQNAICDAANRGVSIAGGSAYITHYPCLNCFKMLIASGIKHIYYINNYNNNPIISRLLRNINDQFDYKYASSNEYYSLEQIEMDSE